MWVSNIAARGTVELSASSIPSTREHAMKIKLELDTLSVDSFDTCHAADARGSVQAHQDNPTRACNTRTPFCQLPSAYRPCITDEVECA